MGHDIVRKDWPPAVTIDRVQGILDSLGFPRERAIVRRWAAGPDCHSCHLRFANYPMLCANGKGVTPDLALASALAEYMEGLQCRADTVFTRAGNIHRLPPFAPRAVRSFDQVAATAPRLAAMEFRDLTSETPRAFPCLSFVDVPGARVVELPFDVLCLMTGSNGMCAGNTPEEAIAHGICEVFERHAIHAVVHGRVPGLPTLPLETLPLRSRVVKRQIETLLSAGIEVLVKDATMGGLYPVVALVLVDRSADTCGVAFGADPDFDIAVSRCVTEAFQNISRLICPLHVKQGTSRPLDTYNNVEVLADALFDSVGPPLAEGAFGGVDSNASALRFVVDRVRQARAGLYVRDCSVFGFPAYYVYVEGLSALTVLRPEDFSFLVRHLGAVRTAFFRLSHATRSDIAHCSQVLFDELTRCNPLLERQFASGVLEAPVAACVGLREVLVLMLLEIERLEEARAVLALPSVSSTARVPPTTAADVAALLASYAETRRGAVCVGDLCARFERAFGTLEAGSGGDTEGRAAPLLLPRCECVYSCAACPCRRYCRVEEWYRPAQQLRRRAEPVDQGHLLACLAER